MTLSPYECKVLCAVLDTLFPEVENGPPGAPRLDLVPRVQSILDGLPRMHSYGFRILLYLANILPVFFQCRLATLLGSSDSSREECLHRLFSHPLYLVRQMGLALKGIGALAYFQDPSVREALKLPPVADPGDRALHLNPGGILDDRSQSGDPLDRR